MKKMSRILSWLILVAVVGCGSPDTVGRSDVEVPVSVEQVTNRPIEEYVIATGTVNATRDAIMKTETVGFYRLAQNPATGRKFALGDRVRRDRVVVCVDNPEQENQIRIESKDMALETSRREYEKQQSIYKKGGVTESELKTAERNFLDARLDYENAEIQLAKLEIIAPFDGVIVDLPYFTRGVRISANTEVFRVMDFSNLNMEVNLPGKLMGKVTEGQIARVENYAVPDKRLKGRITQVSPALDSDSRTFKAWMDIPNPEGVLRPGMFVKAEIVTARADSTIVIPKDIIISSRNRKTVYVVNRGIAQERRITTGLENPEEVEVTEGLKIDERLVVKGFETLRNGSKVKITQ